MELDQDLLNLWLSAKDGLSCETARRLIEVVQEARSNGTYARGHNISDRGSLLWVIDVSESKRTPTFSRLSSIFTSYEEVDITEYILKPEELRSIPGIVEGPFNEEDQSCS